MEFSRSMNNSHVKLLQFLDPTRKLAFNIFETKKPY